MAMFPISWEQKKSEIQNSRGAVTRSAKRV